MPPRLRVRRKLIGIVARAAGFAGLGLLASLLVAAGCALWARPDAKHSAFRAIKAGPGDAIDLSGFGRLGHMADPEWAPKTPLSGWVSIDAEYSSGPGLRDADLTVIYWDDGGHGGGNTIVGEHCAGWPWPALRCYCVLRGNAWVWESSWRPPAWLERRAYRGSPDPRIQRPRPPVPLRPEPLGLLADSLFYGAILAAFALGPPTVRRRLRRRRSQCPACGYPTGPAPVCSECGGPVTPRPSALPSDRRS